MKQMLQIILKANIIIIKTSSLYFYVGVSSFKIWIFFSNSSLSLFIYVIINSFWSSFSYGLMALFSILTQQFIQILKLTTIASVKNENCNSSNRSIIKVCSHRFLQFVYHINIKFEKFLAQRKILFRMIKPSMSRVYLSVFFN